MKLDYSNYVPIVKALSDETRLKIIDMLSCGQMCACDILELVNISQSTLSYHMKILTDSKIVIGIKDGSWMRYSINLEIVEEFKSFINEIFTSKDDCICNSLIHRSECKENINE